MVIRVDFYYLHFSLYLRFLLNSNFDDVGTKLFHISTNKNCTMADIFWLLFLKFLYLLAWNFQYFHLHRLPLLDIFFHINLIFFLNYFYFPTLLIFFKKKITLLLYIRNLILGLIYYSPLLEKSMYP
jgi:hypothetical protein